VRLVIVTIAAVVFGLAQPPQREVAVTFDDLPIAGVLPRDIASSRTLTDQLLGAIAAHHVPVAGFVNESKLAGDGGAVDPDRVALLRRWLDAGLELGNHTYSHADFHTASLADFEADVINGEATTRRLLEERGRTLRFFRHPFLHTGRDLATRAGLSSHNLSQLLNEELRRTFFDYINSHRVEEVKRCLLDPAYERQTLLDIAMASGFSSKTAFNTADKRRTHPSASGRPTAGPCG